MAIGSGNIYVNKNQICDDLGISTQSRRGERYITCANYNKNAAQGGYADYIKYPSAIPSGDYAKMFITAAIHDAATAQAADTGTYRCGSSLTSAYTGSLVTLYRQGNLAIGTMLYIDAECSIRAQGAQYKYLFVGSVGKIYHTTDGLGVVTSLDNTYSGGGSLTAENWDFYQAGLIFTSSQQASFYDRINAPYTAYFDNAEGAIKRYYTTAAGDTMVADGAVRISSELLGNTYYNCVNGYLQLV